MAISNDKTDGAICPGFDQRVYLVKTVRDQGALGQRSRPITVYEAYDRGYAYMGDLTADVFQAMLLANKIAQSSQYDYDGGSGSPRGKTKGKALWLEGLDV